MTSQHPVTTALSRHNTHYALLSFTVALVLTGCLEASSASEVAPGADATYYVATDGDDSAAGSEEAPFATLVHAATVAEPGDRVLVRAGTYVTQTVFLNKTGSEEARTTFESYPGEAVTLNGSQTGGNHVFDASGGSYYDIRGFEIRDAQGMAVFIRDGHHIRVFDSTIHNGVRSAVYADEGSSNIDVENNVMYHNIRQNDQFQFEHQGGWDSVVNLDVDGGRVVGNQIYENWGEGIGLYGRNRYAADNVLYDNYSVQIYLSNVDTATVERNFITTTNNSDFYRDLGNGWNGPAAGLKFANENPTADTRLDNLTIRNNIVVGGIFTFDYWNGDWDGGIGDGLKNTLVANNTFVRGTGGDNVSVGIININGDTEHDNVRFVNNLFYSPGGDIAYDWSLPEPLDGLSFEHNAWFGGGYPERLSSSQDVAGDPQLVSPEGSDPSGYQLTAGSPAIGAGMALEGVTEDYFGNPRPDGSGVDIGAHEHSE